MHRSAIAPISKLWAYEPLKNNKGVLIIGTTFFHILFWHHRSFVGTYVNDKKEGEGILYYLDGSR